MATPLPLADEIRDAAAHGSYCPKMCTYACPVATATGLDEAVPWSFHRTVADLAEGRADTSGGWARLRHCNGCLACQKACTYEQDVPSQVLAARAALVASGDVPDDVAAALEHLRHGRTATGGAPAELPESNASATTAIVLSLDESDEVVAALEAIAKRARVPVRWLAGPPASAPQLRALGRPDLAAQVEAQLPDLLAGVTSVICSDPWQLEGLAAVVTAEQRLVDVTTWLLGLLENGRLLRSAAPALGRVTWHDHPAMGRVHGVTAPARQVLRLLGGVLVEPEHSGVATHSAGPGLGMEVLAPEAVRAVALRRAAQLRGTGAPVVTTGSAERDALVEAGIAVVDLAEVVVDRTRGVQSPSPAASSEPSPAEVDAGSQDPA